LASEFNRSDCSENPPAHLQSAHPIPQCIHNQSVCTEDRRRTRQRFEKAATAIEEALRRGRHSGESFEIPEFTALLESDSVPQLRREINQLLASRERSLKDQNCWLKRKSEIQDAFVSAIPFAKNVLQIAKEVCQQYLR
jgi:hypothetical protein